MAKPPYFPFYVKDFAADGKVEAMTTEEAGAYMFLLCKAWHEDPPCSVPDNDAVLARWARLSEERWNSSRIAVLSAFVLERDGRWYQKRLELEYKKMLLANQKKSVAGKIGATSRWKKINDQYDCHADANADANAVVLRSHDFANGKNMAPGSGSISESFPKNWDGSLREGDVKVWADPTCPNLGGYYPQFVRAAKDVVSHFQKTLSSFHGTSGGESAVIAALVNDSEATPEILKLCADRLAAKMARQEVKKQHVPSVRTFYGSGGYREFIVDQPTATPERELSFTQTAKYREMHPKVTCTPEQTAEFIRQLHASKPVEKQ